MRRARREEVSAGGVVWKRGPRGPLVAFMLDPFGKWTFAKGHVRRGRGESLAAAALRETREEMGLPVLALQEPLGATEIWFRDRFEHRGALVHKRITFFLMEAPAHARGVPARRERISRMAWVPASRAAGFASYANTQAIIKRAVQYIHRRLRKHS